MEKPKVGGSGSDEVAVPVRHSVWVAVGLVAVTCANPPPRPSAPPVPASPDQSVAAVDSKKPKFAGFSTVLSGQPRLQRKVADLWRRIDPDGRKFGKKERRTFLLIDLDRDGRLVAVTVATPSGVPALDDLAIEAIREGAPFPDPPRVLVGPEGLIRFAFSFHFDAVGGILTTPARGGSLGSRKSTVEAAPPRTAYILQAWRRVKDRSARQQPWPPLEVAASPDAAGTFASITVTVDREGAVVDAAVSAPSGITALDDLARAVIRDASPLGKPPPGLTNDGGALSFELGFLFDRGHPDPTVLLPEKVRETQARAIRKTIERSWAVAPESRSTLPPATFRIRTSPAGAIVLVELVRSCGDSSVDQAWRRAIREASPFPAIRKGLAPVLADGVLVELAGRPVQRSPPDGGADATPDASGDR
jgi:TonB family protein